MQHHRSPFLNLGLWTACFHRFRHPAVQYDELYTGCHPVWGERLQMIAYWMVPGELLARDGNEPSRNFTIMPTIMLTSTFKNLLS